MIKPASPTFIGPIAHCLTVDHPAAFSETTALVEQVVSDTSPYPSREQIEALYRDLTRLPNTHLALVYGGATRIKGYVFESPKLPEIRGASALLDWVNNTRIPQLWQEIIEQDWACQCIIYASGGNVLGFAPPAKAQALATAIEHCYTEHTLNANSFAVTQTFHLLEVRYGRLVFDTDGRLRAWVDSFLQDWQRITNEDAPLAQRVRQALEDYYYRPTDSPDTPEARFFQRKTFGELVTVLARLAMRRRDERSIAGIPRHVALYPLLPWAEKCDSSDVRPAVWQGQVADEQREMSEASARKRYVGQILKGDQENTRWHTRTFAWKVPDTLQERSWETLWMKYVRSTTGQMSRYATRLPQHVYAPRDVGDIAAAGGGYIGLIYADGNNVGRRVARCKAPRDYKQLSHDLDAASKEAVFHALSTHLTPHTLTEHGTQRHIHPFEILTIGGDDILIIVPGTAAFDIALAIAYHFEYQLQSRDESEAPLPRTVHDRYRGGDSNAERFLAYTPAIGLSAGVVIAQENAPIFFLRDLVDELLKNAKKATRDRSATDGGMVDFMVLKAITMVTDDIKTFRENALGTATARRMTARPYTWHELAGLLATVRALKQQRFPRSQLYRLRRQMDTEIPPITITSTMEYLSTRVRLRAALQAVLHQHIEQHWQGTGSISNTAMPYTPPWLPLPKQPGDSTETTPKETIWADLLEMYDMVEGLEGVDGNT
ncbi:MAG: hydrolase [Chloroflexaceae bacterium]|nr:hydrolase [Chloroflexaceae bacterium]